MASAGSGVDPRCLPNGGGMDGTPHQSVPFPHPGAQSPVSPHWQPMGPSDLEEDVAGSGMEPPPPPSQQSHPYGGYIDGTSTGDRRPDFGGRTFLLTSVLSIHISF